MSPILIISIVATGVVLTVVALIVALKKSSKNSLTINQPSKKTEIKNDEFDLDDLMDIVKNPKTSSSGVLDALIYFNENFRIDENDSRKYFLFLSRALTHANKNKNIFQYFHNEIKPKNQHFKNELESIEMKALSN